MDLTIEGKAFFRGSFERCCIGIEEGKIVSIKKVLKSEVHFDFSRFLILPSGIDIHVHFRDPGFQYKEDFYTGSQAAAFGGITCVFDMPNTKPPTNGMKEVLEKIKIAERKSVIDFGLYAYNNNFIKIYYPTKEALQKIKTLALIHAEDKSCLDRHKIFERNLQDHSRSRPPECEEIAIKRVLKYAGSSKIHICHLSSRKGLEILKKRPSNISVGVTPHHLLFDIESVQGRQTFFKVNPPIRTSLDREALWSGINKGIINIIESDHAPHTLEEKEESFDAAPCGMPGVETMYPLFLALAKQERISFDRVIKLICENPSKLTRIQKGKIEIGRDADLAIFDHKDLRVIKGDNLHSKCGWSAFEGKKALFPKHVFLRGEIIIEDRELKVNPGFGKCLHKPI